MSRELPERTATPAELAEETRRATRRPTAAELMTGRARPARAPRIRSDETIGRPEDIGTHPAARPAPQPETPNSPHGVNLPPRPEKPVRFTLDLDQERHAFLKTFALECGAGTGGAAVMRALLDELRDSPTLGMKARARLRAGKP